MFRILVVDREESICEALAVGLSSAELLVDVTTSAEQGMMLASDHNYDALVIDPCIPDMDGIDIVRRMKTGSPDMVLIVVTAQMSDACAARLLREGITACFEKPFEMRSIKDAVRNGLFRLEARRGAERASVVGATLVEGG